MWLFSVWVKGSRYVPNAAANKQKNHVQSPSSSRSSSRANKTRKMPYGTTFKSTMIGLK